MALGWSVSATSARVGSMLVEALALLRDARKIEIFTGAGMSAESGLETYRDAQTGIWENVDPQAMASISAWAKDPEPMWAWYLWRAGRAAQATPNAGHRAVAELSAIPEMQWVHVTTQNIDDLHERGGSREVTHLHGSLFKFRCTICHRPWRQIIEFPSQQHERLTPPKCPTCSNVIRPDIVWFGEGLDGETWERSEQAMLEADAVIIIGTSGVVQPAASLPRLAMQRGIPILEISPASSEFTRSVDLFWQSTAATALPELVQALKRERSRS